jgi:hypothetical protein
MSAVRGLALLLLVACYQPVTYVGGGSGVVPDAATVPADTVACSTGACVDSTFQLNDVHELQCDWGFQDVGDLTSAQWNAPANAQLTYREPRLLGSAGSVSVTIVPESGGSAGVVFGIGSGQSSVTLALSISPGHAYVYYDDLTGSAGSPAGFVLASDDPVVLTIASWSGSNLLVMLAQGAETASSDPITLGDAAPTAPEIETLGAGAEIENVDICF